MGNFLETGGEKCAFLSDNDHRVEGDGSVNLIDGEGRVLSPFPINNETVLNWPWYQKFAALSSPCET